MTFSLPNYLNISEFLPNYVRLGLSDIVVILHDFREENRGWGDEDVTETIVARKGDDFVKVSASAHHHVGFGSGGGHHIGPEEPISQLEYEKLTEGKKTIDTSAARKEVELERARLVRHDELERNLNQLAPVCPECGAKLIWRTGKRGPFWGCPNFRERSCHGSASMSADALKVFEELSRT